ncbi:MAG: DUF190 domain-containing protein [Bacteroidales bacterium]|jgi:PII-like signaling protein|nr:DUF190 domain-containing protein [Bacteroidales bacterium]
MEEFKKAKILRIYVSNTDKLGFDTLYEHIALEANKFGLSGMTVYKGIMGYGSSSKMLSDKFWTFTGKVPVTIEIIDIEERINDFLHTILPQINEIPKGCLITMQDTTIILSKKGDKK